MESHDTEGHSVALIFFNDFEARTVEAIAERIIPGGDGDIGATDAGVVYYIDRAVAGFSVSLQKVYRLGLRELEAFCQRKSGKSFIGLSGERQDEVVRRFLGPESRDAAAAHRSAGEDDHDFGTEHAAGPGSRQDPARTSVCGRAGARDRGAVLRSGLWRQSKRGGLAAGRIPGRPLGIHRRADEGGLRRQAIADPDPG